MINGKDVYEVVAAVTPLYVTMALGYLSVRLWKLFIPDQCSGINRFVSAFAVPFLSFHLISTNNPYAMNWQFIAADSIQKAAILVAAFAWNCLFKKQYRLSQDWLITVFSLATLPNTLVIGIPLLTAMYGTSYGDLMVQIVVMQSVVWYTLMLVMFEYRDAITIVRGGDRKANCEAPTLSPLSPEPPVVPGSLKDNDRAGGGRGRGGDMRVSIQQSWSSSGRRVVPDIEMDVELAVTEKVEGGSDGGATTAMRGEVMVKVWRRLVRNPNTYASLLGIVWSLVSFRWNIEMPSIVKGSVSILSNTGLGMAMFSLGLFTASQPKLISCGKMVASLSMAIRFLIGPAVIAVAAIAIGIRGSLLHVAIIQAALPQGIVPFIFAKEYDCHANILSTSLIFGLLLSLPITIVYYVILGA